MIIGLISRYIWPISDLLVLLFIIALIISFSLGPISFATLVNEIRKIGQDNKIDSLERPALLIVVSLVCIALLYATNICLVYGIYFQGKVEFYVLVSIIMFLIMLFEISIVILLFFVGRGFKNLSRNIKESLVKVNIDELKQMCKDASVQEMKRMAKRYDIPLLLLQVLKISAG